MKNTVSKISKTLLFTACTTLGVSSACANSAYDRYIYLGTESGFSEPVVKKFKHEESNTRFTLRNSEMHGGRIGYSFYPRMMFELSGTHQPKYKLSFNLPSSDLSAKLGLPGGSVVIPETPGRTNIMSNVYTFNIIHEFENQIFGVRPYGVIGAGVARLRIKPTTSFWETPALLQGLGIPSNVPFFRIKRHNVDCFAWQFGGGVRKDLTENIALEFGAKLQVVKNVKLRYDSINNLTGLAAGQEPQYGPAETIKKTLGVGEFTVGVILKMPI